MLTHVGGMGGSLQDREKMIDHGLLGDVCFVFCAFLHCFDFFCNGNLLF